MTAGAMDFYTPGEREAVISRLTRLLDSPEFELHRHVAAEVFWGGLVEDLSAEQADWLERSQQAEVNFVSWMLYDLPDGDGVGPTVAEVLSIREGARMTKGERAYLDRAIASHVRLYEVEAVDRGVGFTLKDLWTGETVRVRERAATESIMKWDLMAARIVEDGDGAWVIDGSIFTYPPRAKSEILRALRALHRTFRKKFSGADEAMFFKGIVMFFNQWWLDWTVFPPLPKVVTAEGDEMMFTAVRFDVRDVADLIAALDHAPEFERNRDRSYRWIENLTDDGVRSLGTITIDGLRLVLETTSKPRGRRGRKAIERAAGDAVSYRSVGYQTMAEALVARPRTEPPLSSGLPPAEEARLMKTFLDDHYRKWLDTPIPALSHRTPRHAVRLKTGRPKVIDLLKELENSQVRNAQQGEPVYDVGWLWRELGLEGERG